MRAVPYGTVGSNCSLRGNGLPCCIDLLTRWLLGNHPSVTCWCLGCSLNHSAFGCSRKSTRCRFLYWSSGSGFDCGRGPLGQAGGWVREKKLSMFAACSFLFFLKVMRSSGTSQFWCFSFFLDVQFASSSSGLCHVLHLGLADSLELSTSLPTW
jgi:hypothetical protein